MVQEGINESNGVELRERQISREITKVISLTLTENLERYKGKSTFKTLDQNKNKNIGKFKEFYFKDEIKWTLISIPFIRNIISLSPNKFSVTEFKSRYTVSASPVTE